MIQLAMLHRHTEGLVELTPGTRDLDRRRHVDRPSFSPATGTTRWTAPQGLAPVADADPARERRNYSRASARTRRGRAHDRG
jgi:hypothetical protein